MIAFYCKPYDTNLGLVRLARIVMLICKTALGSVSGQEASGITSAIKTIRALRVPAAAFFERFVFLTVVADTIVQQV